jgi:type II secretory pathway pseudopilin PulG
MTLVEVVGGLALLATLLVALLLAKARYTRQAAGADRRLRAVAAAEVLLTGWRQDARSLPRSGSGGVAGDEGFVWRTQTVANPDVNEMGAAVVRLDIIDDRVVAVENAQDVVTSVEFVVEKDEPRPPAAAIGSPAKTKSPSNAKSSKTTRQPLKTKNAKSLHNP